MATGGQIWGAAKWDRQKRNTEIWKGDKMEIDASITVLSIYKSKVLEVYEKMLKDFYCDSSPEFYAYEDGLKGMALHLDITNGPDGYPYEYYERSVRWERLLKKYSNILKYDGVVIVEFHSCDADMYEVFAITVPDDYRVFERRFALGCIKRHYTRLGERFLNAYNKKTKRRSDGYISEKRIAKEIEAARKAEEKEREKEKVKAAERDAGEIEFQIDRGNLKKVTGTGDTITIPAEVDTISASAFSSKTKVRKVIIPDTVKKLNTGVFLNCKTLEEVVLPEHLTELSNSLFEGCEALKTVNIPAGVKILGDRCFFNCVSLSKIDLPEGLQRIKSYAFVNCYSLTAIHFPDSVEIIDKESFTCSGLETLELPKSLKRVDGFNFLGNRYRLREIESFTKIEERKGFDPEKQTGIRSVIIPENTEMIWGFNGNELLEQVDLLPGQLTGIGGFAKCIRLEKVILPDTVTKIYYNSFSNCPKLKEIHLPDNLQEIDCYAFNNCKELRLESLPASIKKLGTHIFAGCDQITSLTFEGKFPELPGAGDIMRLKSDGKSKSPKEELAEGTDRIFGDCTPGFTVRSRIGFQTRETYTVESTCYPTEITMSDIAFMALCKCSRFADWKARVKYLMMQNNAKEVFSLMAQMLRDKTVTVDKTVISSTKYILKELGAYADEKDRQFIEKMINA